MYAGYTDDGDVEEAFLDRVAGDFVTCPGWRTRFRPGSDRVVAVVPRPCLGDPAWARTGAESVLADDRGTLARDDARRDGRTREEIRVGPALAPG